MAKDTNEVLKERGNRYGNYQNQTRISSEIITAYKSNTASNFNQLESDQEDALVMIAVKISRILNGDPDYSDNWRDIAGYATLVAGRLEQKETEYK